MNLELSDTPSEIPIKRCQTAKFSIYGNNSDESNHSYRYEMIMEGRRFSWLSKYALPGTTGVKHSILRQPDHTVGGNLVCASGVVIVKSSDTNIKFLIPTGDHEGVYSFIRKTDSSWLVVRNLELKHCWMESDDKINSSSDEVEVIGMVTSNKGIGVISKSEVWRSDYVVFDKNIPHISFAKSPKEFNGMVFNGVLSLDGETRSSLYEILRDNAVTSVYTQNNMDAKIKLTPINVLKMPGKKELIETTSADRLKILESFSRYVETDYVYPPHDCAC